MSASMPLLGVPMIGNFGGSGGGGVPAFGARLIQPGALAGGLVTFSRAQAAGAVSTAFAADGVTLQEYGADAPRFNGTARRLLMGGQRTNGVRNPRGEGSGLATFWAGGIAAGLTATYTSGVVVGGIPGVLMRLAGTPGAASTGIRPEGLFTQFPFANGQAASASAFLALVDGAMSPDAVISVNLTSAAGTGLPQLQNATSAFSVVAVGGAPVRTAATLTATDPTTTCARMQWLIQHVTGVAFDATLFLGLPQLELGAFASSPILPPIGTPGASTRGLDNLTASFATLFPSGVGTVLGSFMIPVTAANVPQVLFEIGSGAAANRIRVRMEDSLSVNFASVSAGVQAGNITLGNMTLGALARFGLTFDGSNVTANFNGGTNATITGQSPLLTTLRVCNQFDGAFPAFGEVGVFDALPYVIPGANLPAAVAAIPS